MKATDLFSKRKIILFILVTTALALELYFFINDALDASLRIRIFIGGMAAFAVLLILVLLKTNETLLLSILLGGLMLAYFVICPAGMAPDEEAHFYRAYEISYGSMVSEHIGAEGTGGNYFPEAMDRFFDPDEVNDNKVLMEFTFGNTSLYSPVTYLPQAIGIKIADIFSDKPYDIFMGGRVGGMVFCFMLCVLALKFAPFGKKLMFIIMTFPLSLQEMISMAPDGAIISCSLFMVSFILYLVTTKKKMQTPDMVVLALAVLSLSLNKIVYVVFVLLIFVIPEECFKTRKRAIVYKLSVAAAAVIVNVIWLYIASGYLVEFRPGVDSAAQIRNVLTDPVRFAAVVANTFAKSPDWIPNMISAGMGSLDIPTHPLIWMTVLVLLVYETCNTTMKSEAIPASVPYMLLLVFFGAVALTFASLYVQWTPVGSFIIDGMQGRYLIPVMICLLLSISIFRSEEKGVSDVTLMQSSQNYLAAIMLFCNIEVLTEIIAHYANM